MIEWPRQTAQICSNSTAAMEELAVNTGTFSVKTQMALAAQAAERLKSALPGTAEGTARDPGCCHSGR
jgi:hypothetical protein